MDSTTFKKFSEDDQVIKFGGYQGGYFSHSETKSIIFFAFYHEGINLSLNEPEERIGFELYDINEIKLMLPLPIMESEQYFLVNADHPDYAILFKVSINKQTKTVKLSLEAFPELGESLITDEEREGKEIKLKE